MTTGVDPGGIRLRRALFVVSVLGLLLVPGGAGRSVAPGAGREGPPTVTVATLPLEPAALAFYAKDKGYFAKAGIDAKVLVVSDPAQLVAALLSGEAQFSGLNIGGAAILKSRNAPIRMVASGAMYRPDAPNSALVAAPGKHIKRARDLRGKRIAIDATNTIAHIGLLKWLKTNGVVGGRRRARRRCRSRRCSGRSAAVTWTPPCSPSPT